MEQKSTHRPAMRPGRCDWEILLNEDLPIDLEVKVGAGKTELHLGGMLLDRLRIENGVGELNVDLSGEWKCSLEAFIKAGIGDTTLRLPKNAGVRVQSSVSLGSVRPCGLAWDGAAYTNPLFGKSPVNLDLTLSGGLGKINLIEES